ncbi:MAG: helix-turn-helix domain-containing protein [Pseudomonadota bacterium]
MSSPRISTREKILDATWALLVSGDAAAVRMSDIAKAAKVSRQALYLHFPSRAALLIATTHHLDARYGIEEKLVPSRTAASGPARLDAWIEVWGEHIPRIYGVAKALLAMKDSDEAALAAWTDRMEAVRDGCAAAVRALAAEGRLASFLSPEEATDLLSTLLSVRSWEQLRIDCGWTQDAYLAHLKKVAAKVLIAA